MMKQKRLNNAITLFATATAVCLILAGCSTANNEEGNVNASPIAPPAQSETAAPTATNPPSEATPGTVTEGNPYEAAGINDPAAFNKMFEAVKAAVAANNQEALAEYVQYPLMVNYEGAASVTIDNKEQFLEQYNSIVTSNVQTALASQDTQTLFVNYKGVMAGSGQVWFGANTDDPQKVGIIAINPDTPTNP